MNNPDSERGPNTAPATDEVRQLLRRLLEIIATELAKRLVREQAGFTTQSKTDTPSPPQLLQGNPYRIVNLPRADGSGFTTQAELRGGTN